MKSFRKVKLCWEVKLKRSESVHDFRFQMKVCKGKKVLLFIQFGRFWAKYCQRHSGPRLLSLKLELSLPMKRKKNSFSTFSRCPPLGDHLSHLIHLPAILLVHHHLNDNHHLQIALSASSASIDYWVGIIISQNYISNVSIKQSVTQRHR